MSIRKDKTLENTTIPTTEKAITDIISSIQKVARIQNKKEVILKYVYELNKLVSYLWQGCAHLEHLPEKDYVSIGEYFGKFWEEVINNTHKDVQSFDIAVSSFIDPCMVWRYIPTAINSPKVGVSINRMLGCQFHMSEGDEPSVFLLRHLGLRLALCAFAKINDDTDSTLIKKLSTISFPEKWIDVPEIKVATNYYSEDYLSNHFSYLILKETLVMADLFELLLFKLQE